MHHHSEEIIATNFESEETVNFNELFWEPSRRQRREATKRGGIPCRLEERRPEGRGLEEWIPETGDVETGGAEHHLHQFQRSCGEGASPSGPGGQEEKEQGLQVPACKKIQ